MARPCPTSGLARAQWLREAATEAEDSNPQVAAHCRATAAAIERREMGALPLVRLMDDQHPSQS